MYGHDCLFYSPDLLCLARSFGNLRSVGKSLSGFVPLGIILRDIVDSFRRNWWPTLQVHVTKSAAGYSQYALNGRVKCHRTSLE